MEIKAVNSINSSLEMNSQNIKNSQIEIEENKNGSKEIKDQIKELFDKLDTKSQNDILKKSIEEINKKFNMLNSQLKIEIDRDTNIKVAKIIDTQTKKVIRQIPPETVLKIAKYVDEVTGLLFNKKA